MDIQTFLVLIFLRVICGEETDKRGLVLTRTKGNVSQATEICLVKNMKLPVVRNKTDREKLRVAMVRARVTETWLGQYWEDTGVWRWLSGDPPEETVVRDKKPGWMCGALRYGILYATDCNQQLNGYVCRRADCVVEAAACYQLQCSRKVTWLEADTSCKAAGMCLAYKNTSAIREAVDGRHCKGDVWLGLTRAVMAFFNPNSDDLSSIVNTTNVTFNNTSLTDQCVTAHVEVLTLGLRLQPCKARHPVVCYGKKTPFADHPQSTNEATTAPPSTGHYDVLPIRQDTGSLLYLVYLVPAIYCGLMLISGIILSVVCLGSYRKSRKQGPKKCTGGAPTIDGYTQLAMDSLTRNRQPPSCSQVYQQPQPLGKMKSRPGKRKCRRSILPDPPPTPPGCRSLSPVYSVVPENHEADYLHPLPEEQKPRDQV